MERQQGTLTDCIGRASEQARYKRSEAQRELKAVDDRVRELIGQGGVVSIFPLLGPEGEQQSSYRRALSLLTSSVNWEFKSEDYTFRRSLVSHVH